MRKKYVYSSLKLIALIGMLQIFAGMSVRVSAITIAPATSNVIVHKLQYDEDHSLTIVNDGSELDLPSGVERYNPDKYGTVSFSIVDISEYSQEKKIEEIQTELNQLEQEEYSSWISLHGQFVETQTVNNNGTAIFANLPSTREDGSIYVYAVLETKSPVGLVKQIAQPIILTLPMTNSEGNGFLTDVNIYPKNQVQELTLTLTKYSEAFALGNELSGVTFDVYSGKPADGVKINDVPLVTDENGQLSITGLTVGHYYLVETRAPDGHALHPNAQNNIHNKLTFKITKDGIHSEALKIDFINYKLPESVKTVSNGTAPETNNSSFAIGDAVDYKNVINVPTDIAGGQLITINEEQITTQNYTIFNYTDIGGTGLTYEGDENSVVVTGSNEKQLIVGTDYTYKSQSNGFTIDFILSGGKVSQNVADLAGGEIHIAYQMIINEQAKAIIENGQGIDNSYDLSWSNNFDKDSNSITGQVSVYTGGAKFIKEDKYTSERLAGAKFVLMNDQGEYFNGWVEDGSGNKQIQWVTEEPTDGEAILVSGMDGSFEIFGLPYGKYELKEIQAPNNYALATKTIDFEIISETYTGEIMTIQNTKRVDLPLTGSVQLLSLTIFGMILLVTSIIYYKKREQVK